MHCLSDAVGYHLSNAMGYHLSDAVGWLFAHIDLDYQVQCVGQSDEMRWLSDAIICSSQSLSFELSGALCCIIRCSWG